MSEQTVRVQNAGHFEGEIFYFEPPVEMITADQDGVPIGKSEMAKLDFTGATFAQGVSKSDVIEALLNADAAL